MAGMMSEWESGASAAPWLTPYELAFGHPYFEEERFPAILEEAEARGVATWSPERFLLLGTVGALLRELLPEGAGGEEFERYGRLLHQAYHFWAFGRRLYVVDEGVARGLVEATPTVGSWELTSPHPAGYLRLPRHLFWSRVDEGAAPEPVDGIFWTLVGEEDPMRPPYRRLDAMLVLGMRADRPGFGTIPIGTDLVAAPLGHWADADARPEGRDFENILPGGELHRWYGLVTEGEALRLISLLFWHVAVFPGSIGGEEVPSAAGPTSPRELPPTALPFRRIREVGGDG
jgi:hypothetical protein